MATIKKRGDSYLIRVSCGYDINGNHKEQSFTWKPDEGMSKKQIEKELNRSIRTLQFRNYTEHLFSYVPDCTGESGSGDGRSLQFSSAGYNNLKQIVRYQNEQ